MTDRDSRELLGLEGLVERLGRMGEGGGLPPHVRLCVGTDPQKNGEVFSRRVFVGLEALWMDLSVETEKIREELERLGYASHATQRVPDGFGRNYDSVYYRLGGAK